MGGYPHPCIYVVIDKGGTQMEFFLEEEDQTTQLGPSSKSKTLRQDIAGVPVDTTVTVTPIDEGDREKGCQDFITRPIETFEHVSGPEQLQGGKIDDVTEGMQWIVEYYSQYLSKDGIGQYHSLDTLFGFQQYRRIVKFPLKVDSALSFNYEAEFSTGENVGNAKVMGSVIPNKGDCFIAEIGDGRLAVLNVNTVRRMSGRAGSMHEIEFSVSRYLTPEIKTDLLNKTIDTLVYGGEGSGLLTVEEVGDLATLEQEIHRLTESYFRWFMDTDTSSFSVPLGIGVKIYDVFQAIFVDKLIDKTLYPKYRHTKLQRIDIPNKIRQTSIWDALLERDYRIMDDAATYFHFIQTSEMRAGRYQWNGSYSRYKFVIYPYYLGDTQPRGIRDISRYTAPAEMPIFVEEDPTINRRWIYHIRSDEDYVFSHWFYLKDDENMSMLERLVWCYLEGKDPCINRLLQLLRACHRWDDLDRYYYIPVLILLGKSLLVRG